MSNYEREIGLEKMYFNYLIEMDLNFLTSSSLLSVLSRISSLLSFSMGEVVVDPGPGRTFEEPPDRVVGLDDSVIGLLLLASSSSRSSDGLLSTFFDIIPGS
jgi:hypothetical protein